MAYRPISFYLGLTLTVLGLVLAAIVSALEAACAFSLPDARYY
jgi:hypothetical protein